MRKTSKSKSKGKVINNKKNNTKNNSKKLPLIIVIVGIILIVAGVGGYLLSNKGLPGGGFNIMKPQPVDGGCRVSNCNSCKPNNPSYCVTCKSGYTQSNGNCVPTCNVSNCTKCSSPNKCSQCKSGYTLSGGKCLKRYRVKIVVTNGTGSSTKIVTQGASLKIRGKCNNKELLYNPTCYNMTEYYEAITSQIVSTYYSGESNGVFSFTIKKVKNDVYCDVRCK